MMFMSCDICGNPNPKHVFLRRVKAEDWKFGFKDVWSCQNCIDLCLELKEILEGEGCLNSMEVCRILNGFERDDFKGCYANRKFAYITRPERCNHKERGCVFWSLTVYNALRKLEAKGIIASQKTTHYDNRKGKGLKLDVFRFWFINRQDFINRIEKQKLTGYIVR